MWKERRRKKKKENKIWRKENETKRKEMRAIRGEIINNKMQSRKNYRLGGRENGDGGERKDV